MVSKIDKYIKAPSTKQKINRLRLLYFSLKDIVQSCLQDGAYWVWEGQICETTFEEISDKAHLSTTAIEECLRHIDHQLVSGDRRIQLCF